MSAERQEFLRQPRETEFLGTLAGALGEAGLWDAGAAGQAYEFERQTQPHQWPPRLACFQTANQQFPGSRKVSGP